MILLTILVVMAISAAIIALAIIGTIGGAAIVMFGDVIVFILIVAIIIKLISKFRR